MLDKLFMFQWKVFSRKNGCKYESKIRTSRTHSPRYKREMWKNIIRTRIFFLPLYPEKKCKRLENVSYWLRYFAYAYVRLCTYYGGRYWHWKWVWAAKLKIEPSSGQKSYLFHKANYLILRVEYRKDKNTRERSCSNGILSYTVCPIWILNFSLYTTFTQHTHIYFRFKEPDKYFFGGYLKKKDAF